MQIGAELLCKDGKVEPEYRVRITEYRVRSTEGWQAVGGCTANGRDAVAPLPDARRQRGTGGREVGRRTDATQSRPYLEAVKRRRKKGGREVGGAAKPLLESL